MTANSVQNLGKYRVLNELGRDVALRVLDPLLTRAPVWVGRFRREALPVAGPVHSRVITVLGIGQVEGVLQMATRMSSG